MSRRLPFFVLFGLVLPVLSCGRQNAAEPAKAAPAANSDSIAMFGGSPQRNMVNLREKNLPIKWDAKDAKKENVKWAVELGSVAYGGPVISGGKIFVGTNNENPRDKKITGDKGVLMCFDAANGKLLWQAVHDKLDKIDPDDGDGNDYAKQGIASGPAVEGNRLYYVSNRCEVVCADVETGKSHWTLDMVKELGVYPRYLANCSPLLVGDVIFVNTGQGINGRKQKVVNPEAPSFVAVDKKSGKVKWSKSYPGAKIMDGQWSNPTYAVVSGKAQVIFGGGDGWLYGLSAENGEIVWKFFCNPKKSVFRKMGVSDRCYFLATPVVYDNKVYIGVGRDPDNDGTGVGHFWCIDLTKTGDVSPVDDNFDPKAAVNKNSGLVWHFGGPTNSKEASAKEYFFGRTLATCAIHDDLVYVTDLDGFLYCLDAKTGKKYWEHDMKSTVWASPYYADGKVYIGTADSEVHVLAHGKEKKLLATNEVDKFIRGPVVAADGVLYVQTDYTLYAISAKGK